MYTRGDSVDVFFCYSHRDEGLRDELEKHLTILLRQGFISSWHDRRIDAGDRWESAIEQALDKARIVLLLVSPDFLASDFCYEREMQRALARHQKGDATVVPIILRAVDWELAPFADLQALPKDAMPVTSWPNVDEAFRNVAIGLRGIVTSIRGLAETKEQDRDAAKDERVDLNYTVRLGDREVTRALGFRVLVLSDLLKDDLTRSPEQREIRQIGEQAPEEIFERVRVPITLLVDEKLSPQNLAQLSVQLSFGNLQDFEPENVARSIPELDRLLRIRSDLDQILIHLGQDRWLRQAGQRLLEDWQFLTDVRDIASGPTTITSVSPGPDDERPDVESMSASDFVEWFSKVVNLEVDSVKDLLNELVPIVENIESGRRFDQAVNGSMESIDNRLSEQLSVVLQAPEFLRVEAAFRSLHRLVAEMESGSASLHLLTVTRRELEEEALGSRAPERTTLEKKVWERLEHPDGEPFSLIIADFEFSYTKEDVAVLRLLSRIGSSTQAPVVAAASPGLLDLEDWSDLDKLPDLSRQFDLRKYGDWKHLCHTSDAQFLTLVNPRWLLRSTHEVGSDAKAPFRFAERVEHRERLCWGNPAYLVALCAVRAFGRFSWTARVEGLDGGGLIEDLPQPVRLETPDGDLVRCGPVETLVPESIEYLLAQRGLCSLCAFKNSNRAVFRSLPTLAKPAGEGDVESGVWLPTILAATRVSQHLLRMLQDGLQRRTDPRELEAQANRWLSRYVSYGQDKKAASARAARPLAWAEVTISSFDPERRRHTVHLSVHPVYQLRSHARVELEFSLSALNVRS